ncbi:MAG TPA: hypothetical protein DEA22_09485, partial [Blastocatellia bacterium]|nr:hypothetical protein [Blastocatellia bacterium]
MFPFMRYCIIDSAGVAAKSSPLGQIGRQSSTAGKNTENTERTKEYEKHKKAQKDPEKWNFS